jgi:YggT family protein
MLASVFLTFFNLFVLVMNALIIARVIASWVAPESQFGNGIKDLTEPVLAPVRKVLPDMGMIDLSPMATIIGLNLLQTLVNNLILGRL